MHVDKLKPCHDPEEQTLDSRLPVDASEITSDDDQASDVQGIGDDTMGHVPPTFDLSWARRGGAHSQNQGRRQLLLHGDQMLKTITWL